MQPLHYQSKYHFHSNVVLMASRRIGSHFFIRQGTDVSRTWNFHKTSRVLSFYGIFPEEEGDSYDEKYAISRPEICVSVVASSLKCIASLTNYFTNVFAVLAAEHWNEKYLCSHIDLYLISESVAQTAIRQRLLSPRTVPVTSLLCKSLAYRLIFKDV